MGLMFSWIWETKAGLVVLMSLFVFFSLPFIYLLRLVVMFFLMYTARSVYDRSYAMFSSLNFK